MIKKVSNRQRKHLLRMGPIHHDAEGALLILLNNEPAVEDELREDELQDALVDQTLNA